MDWIDGFSSQIEKKEITIGIIGLGYVGLPTAIGFHDAGFTVWGVDISKRTVDMILRGKTPLGTPMLMILFHNQTQKDGILLLLQLKQCLFVTSY